MCRASPPLSLPSNLPDHLATYHLSPPRAGRVVAVVTLLAVHDRVLLLQPSCWSPPLPTPLLSPRFCVYVTTDSALLVAIHHCDVPLFRPPSPTPTPVFITVINGRHLPVTLPIRTCLCVSDTTLSSPSTCVNLYLSAGASPAGGRYCLLTHVESGAGMADEMSDSEVETAVVVSCMAAAEAVVRAANDGSGWMGRVPGSARNIDRGVSLWFLKYLSPSPMYNRSHFRALFRVPMRLYRAFERELPLVEPLLLQKEDCTGRAGHPLHVKLVSALRRLGNGVSFADIDDQACMSIESQRQNFLLFLRAVRTRFGPRYLNREPTALELQKISDAYGARGFPGCVGCADCMTIKWKNCPRAFKGQYHNPKDGKLAVLRCEAVVDGDLYCWHWFAGRPGTNNDVTVLDNSPYFMDILSGRRQMLLPNGYALGGVTRHWLLYLLGDSAYPRWAIFYRPTAAPLNEKEAYAGQRQVTVRKDVERFFGCLQGRFHILRGERREWSDETIILIADVCVIVHNLIVCMRQSGELEEEASDHGGALLVEEFCADLPVDVEASASPAAAAGPVPVVGLAALLERSHAVMSETAHETLTAALADHLWDLRGQQ